MVLKPRKKGHLCPSRAPIVVKDARKRLQVADLLSEDFMNPGKAANIIGVLYARVYQIQRDL